VRFAVENDPNSVSLDDLVGDGDLDPAASNQSAGALSVLLDRCGPFGCP